MSHLILFDKVFPMKKYQMIDFRRKALIDWLNSRRNLDHDINDQLTYQNSFKRILEQLEFSTIGDRENRNLEREQNLPSFQLESITKEFEKIEHRFNKDEGTDYPISNQDKKNGVPYSSPNLNLFKNHVRPSPLEVSSSWLNQNISDVDCIKEFIIVTDPPVSS